MAKTVLSPRAAALRGAIIAYVGPRLAKDAKIDLRPVVGGLTSKNYAAKMPATKLAIDAALKGKLKVTGDAEAKEIIDTAGKIVDMFEKDPDTEDADPEEMSGEDEWSAEDEESFAALSAKKAKVEDRRAHDGETPEEREKRVAAEKKASDEERERAADGERAEDEEGGVVTKKAMDAALAANTRAVETRVMARLKGVADAKEAVKALGLGEVTFDSADRIYEYALKQSGVALDGVPPAAFPAMVRMLVETAGRRESPRAIALDAAVGDELAQFNRAMGITARAPTVLPSDR